MSQILDVNDLLEETTDARSPFVRAPHIPSFKPTVLVATHSRSTRNSISVTLQSVGYHVLTVADAYATAESLQQSPEIGLVLLDQCLPEFDGFQLCKAIRQSGAYAPPVVILSKRTGLWNRLKAKTAGAVGMLKKPVRPDQLLTLVEKNLPVVQFR